jgi:probable HAF family extracellular repeat protein
MTKNCEEFMNRSSFLRSALVVASCLPALAAAVPTYTAIDLGGATTGLGINASGQVTGETQQVGGNPHAFLYSSGSMTDLGTLGGTSSVGFGINASGQVTGQYTQVGSDRHAFLYSGSTMTDLGTLGGAYSLGHSINASGQVVGWSHTTDFTERAFLYSGGTIDGPGHSGRGGKSRH